MERGVIRNREFATRIKDFSGLRFGAITPTDIDGFIDFQNKAFVFIEIKYGYHYLLYGQSLALKRLCDACQKAGIETLLLIGNYCQPGDIDVARLHVTRLYRNNIWREPRHPITIRRAVDQFLRNPSSIL